MEDSLRTRLDELQAGEIEGELYIIYERLADFKWLPGRGDGQKLRDFKHWKLLIVLGEERITVEFLENHFLSQQGQLLVERFPQHYAGKVFLLGKLTLCPRELYEWFLHSLYEYTKYDILRRNCQGFVVEFLIDLHTSLHSRTPHLETLLDGVPNYKRVPVKRRLASLFKSLGSRSKSRSRDRRRLHPSLP
ncbi:hypothetical protein EMPS_00395 [Entomortierella parvispora]|uniref:PPPDE domain-containing protein n=1 Tax=Entomortierella parvispora TaxID=205924 RepID=A0A9P3LRN7_9FUNG|nr:hypothetical protein EMPS_00395 [Entomortierella parvispora]